ncbi:MAG: ATP-binding protein, partial [Streptomyces sp.]|nr:ATP-binding protein [Streptomyces sp.]
PAAQVVGDRVATGFTREIHDRGLGLSAEALLDANLRLAETPEFELSDTDRLGLVVVSRLAQRQNVRVSLQPSPYGGTTAVVFIPDALLTDDVPDTNGVGFRLDRALPDKKAKAEEGRTAALPQRPVELPGVPASILDGPVELEALDGFPDDLDDEGSDRGGLFRPRPSLAKAPSEQHQQARDSRREAARPGDFGHPGAPVPLPRRRTPKLVSSHGRPVKEAGPGGDGEPERSERDTRGLQETERSAGRPEEATGGATRVHDDRLPALPQRRRTQPEADPDRTTSRQDPQADPADPADPAETGTGALPRRVRQASLAPQLKKDPDARDEHEQSRTTPGAGPAERDADEVRSRFASLQRGWQRGREENAAGDDTRDASAPGTTKGDGR